MPRNIKSSMPKGEIDYFNKSEQQLSVSEKLLQHIGLNWEDLRGKQVLEVGASYAYLAAEGKDRGVDNIISLDLYGEYSRKTQKYIQGEVEHLPLKVESVDIIISSCGPLLPWYGTQEEASARLKESWKVLKNDGRVFIWPAWIEKNIRRSEREVGEFIKKRKLALERIVGDLYEVKILHVQVELVPYFGGDYSIQLIKKLQAMGQN